MFAAPISVHQFATVRQVSVYMLIISHAHDLVTTHLMIPGKHYVSCDLLDDGRHNIVHRELVVLLCKCENRINLTCWNLCI
jgi:hypothetical protein